MSIHLIEGKEYDVKLNKMFIQPHFVINDITTDIGIWEDISTKAEADELLKKAVRCYEFNKKNNTLEYNNFNRHISEHITTTQQSSQWLSKLKKMWF